MSIFSIIGFVYDQLDNLGAASQIKDMIHSVRASSRSDQTVSEGIIDPDGASRPFGPHYAAHISPFIDDFESKRIKAKAETNKRMHIALPIGGIALGLIAAFAYSLPKHAFDIILFAGIFSAGGLYSWVIYPRITFQKDIQSTIYPLIFRFFGDDFSYHQESPLPYYALEHSGILPHHNKSYYRDYVKGSYGGVMLEYMHAKLVVKGDKSKRNAFMGIFIRLSMNKAFLGKTIIKRDKTAVGNFLERKFQSLENIKLEDPRFEKAFEVYGSDQVEARYLLTPSFMERLLHLEELMGQKGIQASFYDDHLLLMIPSDTKRFKASSIHHPVTFFSDINSIIAQMQDIFDIITMLKLHEQTRL